jgi:hypothetical protein
MKALLTVTAVAEAGAGLALLCCPSVAASLLLGASLETSAAVTIGCIGGVALLALGFASWFARDDAGSRAARGLIATMAGYNLGVALVLGAAGIQRRTVGIAFWPAVLFHAAMTAWCITSMRRRTPRGPVWPTEATTET